MYSGFFKLFLGLLFQFNFVFRGVDLLPDVVGYYFIFKGLKILAGENDYFKRANQFILPLLILSLVNFYNFQYHQDFLLSIPLASDAIRIIKLLVFALNIFLVYQLFKGTIEVAKANKDSYLSKNLLQRLYLYLGVSIFFLLISILSLIPSLATVASVQSLFLIAYYTYLFALLIIVSGMYKMYRTLAPARAKPVTGKSGGNKAGKSGKYGKSGKSGQAKRKR